MYIPKRKVEEAVESLQNQHEPWILRISWNNGGAKGGFFSESAMRFLDLQISKKNILYSYPELEI